MKRLFGQNLSDNETGTSWAEVAHDETWLPVLGDYSPGMLLVEGEQDGERVYFAREREKTPEELTAEAAAVTRAAIHAAYTVDAELKLLNAAIEALAEGKQPPQEYLDYRDTVKQIREEKAT